MPSNNSLKLIFLNLCPCKLLQRGMHGSVFPHICNMPDISSNQLQESFMSLLYNTINHTADEAAISGNIRVWIVPFLQHHQWGTTRTRCWDKILTQIRNIQKILAMLYPLWTMRPKGNGESSLLEISYIYKLI